MDSRSGLAKLNARPPAETLWRSEGPYECPPPDFCEGEPISPWLLADFGLQIGTERPFFGAFEAKWVEVSIFTLWSHPQGWLQSVKTAALKRENTQCSMTLDAKTDEVIPEKRRFSKSMSNPLNRHCAHRRWLCQRLPSE